MSLIIVGSLAFDTIETPATRRERIMGGSCAYASLAASFFTNPKIVAVVGEDYPQDMIDLLKSRGVDIRGLRVEPGDGKRPIGAQHHPLPTPAVPVQEGVHLAQPPRRQGARRGKQVQVLNRRRPDLPVTPAGAAVTEHPLDQTKYLHLAGGKVPHPLASLNLHAQSSYLVRVTTH